METDLSFFVKDGVNPDAAAYAAYAAIMNHMVDDKYIGVVQSVLLLEYLSPPLVPFLSDGTDNDTKGGNPGSDTLQSSDADQRLQFSPWSIGVLVATVTGSVIALVVYNRTRRVSRQNQRIDQPAHEHADDLERMYL